jgi:membrane-anchored glycerophosphoryl diester phosphodiesterase (GDPDase)
MRLSAADCLRRGWANLSANWELVFLQWLQLLLVAALLALSLVSPLAVLGSLGAGRTLSRTVGPALLLALVALLALWALSLLVYSFFQAGTYGILAAADRQALPGGRRSPLFFRTFSLRDFLGWGGRYVWRFAGAGLLFAGALLLLAGGAAFWLGATATTVITAGGAHLRGPAALGVGFGWALPLGFAALVAVLGFSLAQADLARQESGVRAAWRRALAVLGRRPGTVLALVVLVLGAGLLLALLFAPVTAAADALLAGAPGVRSLVRGLLFLVQSLPNTLLAMVLAGALVALVRSETPSDLRRNPEVQTA